MSNRYIGGLIYNAPGGWSGQFGASSTDMISAASNAAFAFGTGDFTIEAFVLATTSQTDNWIVGLHNNCWLRIGSGGKLEFYNSVGSSSILAGSAMPLNQWVHVAAVRSGTTLTIYQDGVSVASGTVSTNFSSSVACTIGNQSGFDRRWNGYISNVRVVKGTAVYTSAFTPPNGPLQAITNTSLLTCRYPTFVDGSSNNFTLTVSGSASVNTANPFPLTNLPNPALGGAGNGVFTISQYRQLAAQNLWPAIDPYYENVVLNLHGNGTNGGQNNTFLDSSSNNFSITRNGNTTQGTFGPYGQNWSNYLDGSGDYLFFPNSSAFAFGTGSFTIEFWINGPLNNDKFILGGRSAIGSMHITTGGSSSTAGVLRYVATSTITSGSVLITDNAWHHCAIVRNGSSNVTLYVDGVAVGTGTDTNNYTTTSGTWTVGANDFNYPSNVGSNQLTAYLSNLRVVAGVAVYTSNFTPPAAPLTSISGTAILTCGSNRFLDASGNSIAVTPSGNPRVQRFSPFNPPIPYDASWAGGSGYFDGSGDYLSRTNDSAFAFGTGDFTVECWINTTSSNVGLAETSGGSTGYWMWHINGSTGNMAWQNSRGTNNLLLIAGASTALCNGAWHHLAIVRNSGTTKAYWDGVEKASAADTTNYNGTGGNLNVGYESAAGLYLTGNMAGFRIVKGTAVYTAAFTPPTAPPTAITNTSLLLNFTNASIVDNAMMNDLETVGNAQISTTQKKYGTASMYFDGTGDGLRGPANMPQIQLGSGDFTVECWLYQTATNTYPSVLEIGNHLGTGGILFIASNGSTITAYSQSYGGFMGTATAPSLNTWNHIAWVRYNGTFKIYVNGVGNTGVTATTNFNSSSTLTIGAEQSFDSSYTYTGYIDDLRVTKGVARYITNFTPPTSQVQDM